MVAIVYDLVEFIIPESRRKNMDFSLKFLSSETSFVKAACRCTIKILLYERIQRKHGEGLLGEQDLTPRLLFCSFKDLEVPYYFFFVYHISGSFDFSK